MKRIEYKHDFFENAMTAMVKYLVMLYQPFSNVVGQNTIVGFVNSGDEKFLQDMILSGNQYDYTPRCSLVMIGLTEQRGDRSNKNTYGKFQAKNLDNKKIENYSAQYRRVPIDVSIEAEMVFTNIFEYLTFVEIYLMMTDEYHSFNFWHGGNVYNAILELPEIAEPTINTEFGINSDTRQWKMVLNYNLKTQFPAFKIYGIAGTNFVGNNDYRVIHPNQGMNVDDGGIITTGTNPNDPNTPNSSGEAGAGSDGTIVQVMEKIIHNTTVGDSEGALYEPTITQIITKNNTDE